jgi:hypothetical protein
MTMRRLRSIASAAILTTNPLAQLLSRKILPTGDDVKGAVEKILTEIKDIKSNISTDRQTGTKQKTGSLAGGEDFEFRPLTEEEKKEFVSSLDAKSNQTLLQLAGETKNSSDTDENVVSICGL